MGVSFVVQYNNNEPRHEISNNVVCATSKASDQPAHTRSLIRAFTSRLNILSFRLLTDHHLEFLSLKGGCTGSSESTLVKMPHCRKSHVGQTILLKGNFISNRSEMTEQKPTNKRLRWLSTMDKTQSNSLNSSTTSTSR